MGPEPERHGGAWHGAISLAEPDSVQGLRGACERGERAVEEGVVAAIRGAEIDCDVFAVSICGQGCVGAEDSGGEKDQLWARMRAQRPGAESDV